MLSEPATAPLPRLRQAVIAAADLEAATQRLRTELDLGEPFHDEAVGHFGLENSMFAIGDTFLEVVAPVSRNRRRASQSGGRPERPG